MISVRVGRISLTSFRVAVTHFALAPPFFVGAGSSPHQRRISSAARWMSRETSSARPGARRRPRGASTPCRSVQPPKPRYPVPRPRWQHRPRRSQRGPGAFGSAPGSATRHRDRFAVARPAAETSRRSGRSAHALHTRKESSVGIEFGRGLVASLAERLRPHHHHRHGDVDEGDRHTVNLVLRSSRRQHGAGLRANASHQIEHDGRTVRGQPMGHGSSTASCSSPRGKSRNIRWARATRKPIPLAVRSRVRAQEEPALMRRKNRKNSAMAMR